MTPATPILTMPFLLQHALLPLLQLRLLQHSQRARYSDLPILPSRRHLSWNSALRISQPLRQMIRTLASRDLFALITSTLVI